MVAKADHKIGEGNQSRKDSLTNSVLTEEKRMFNIGYLAGIIILLVVWLSIYIGALVTGLVLPIREVCMGEPGWTNWISEGPIIIGTWLNVCPHLNGVGSLGVKIKLIGLCLFCFIVCKM